MLRLSRLWSAWQMNQRVIAQSAETRERRVFPQAQGWGEG